MSRADDYAKLGITVQEPKVVEPLLEQISRNEEQAIWKGDLFSSPHGTHWSTAFHSSEFPGDPETACPRKAMYGLMNIPGPEPAPRMLRATAESGMDLEDRIVKRFERAGILLSEPIESEHQTNFQKPERWLSGSSDAIIRVPRKNSPHVCEIKSKFQKKIDQMRAGECEYDPQHKNQIMCYIGFCHDYGHLFWPELEPCDSGTLLYVSRDNPSITYEYQFSYHSEWWKIGLEHLAEWQQYFLKGELPPKPKDFMWSKGPCRLCKFKKRACKPDFLAGVKRLEDSAGIDWAKEVYDFDYDYIEQRKKVLERWDAEDES